MYMLYPGLFHFGVLPLLKVYLSVTKDRISECGTCSVQPMQPNESAQKHGKTCNCVAVAFSIIIRTRIKEHVT